MKTQSIPEDPPSSLKLIKLKISNVLTKARLKCSVMSCFIFNVRPISLSMKLAYI